MLYNPHLLRVCVPRIVCEMGKAEKSQYTGNVQVCVGIGECRPEFMAKSSKYYYFVVRCPTLWSNNLHFVCIILEEIQLADSNTHLLCSFNPPLRKLHVINYAGA